MPKLRKIDLFNDDIGDEDPWDVYGDHTFMGGERCVYCHVNIYDDGMYGPTPCTRDPHNRIAYRTETGDRQAVPRGKGVLDVELDDLLASLDIGGPDYEPTEEYAILTAKSDALMNALNRQRAYYVRSYEDMSDGRRRTTAMLIKQAEADLNTVTAARDAYRRRKARAEAKEAAQKVWGRG